MLFFKLNSQVYNLSHVELIDFEGAEGLIDMVFTSGLKVALVHESQEKKYDLDNYPGVAYILPSQEDEEVADLLMSVTYEYRVTTNEEFVDEGETEDEVPSEEPEETEEEEEKEVQDGDGEDKESSEPEA